MACFTPRLLCPPCNHPLTGPTTLAALSKLCSTFLQMSLAGNRYLSILEKGCTECESVGEVMLFCQRRGRKKKTFLLPFVGCWHHVSCWLCAVSSRPF